MLTRFLDWYFSTELSTVVWIREFVRRHKALRAMARALLFAIRGSIERLRMLHSNARALIRALPSTSYYLRDWMWPTIDSSVSAILTARATGGAISISELEKIWDWGKRSRCALCLGAPPELAQIDIMLRAARTRSITLCRSPADAKFAAPVSARFDLIVAPPAAQASEFADQLSHRSQDLPHFLKVPEIGSKRSDYYRFAAKKLKPERGTDKSPQSLYERLAQGDRLRVVLLNDVGFQYGAGVALRRQAASFLLNGWDVAVVAWKPGLDTAQPSVTGLKDFDNWLGVHEMEHIHASQGLLNEQIVAEVAAKVNSLNPDIVITGNLHGAGWPIGILTRLQERGVMVAAYMHDVYLVTGRCAQPMSCQLFRTGCDASCPTPDEYPALAPEKIAGAWQDRAEVFTGKAAIPLIANSSWTHNVVSQRFGNAAHTDMVHLGLDESLFSPISKSAARRLLRLPQNKPIVVMGAVDVSDRWKGGPLFRGVHQALLKRRDVGIILFGRSSEMLPSTKSFGMVRDERLMPLILNAADIFVATGIAESFGQTLLEASACALPVVAFDVGGVRDVIVNEQTGYLVNQQSVDALLAIIDKLIADPTARETLGQNGRLRVEQQFTLSYQAKAWINCLKRLAAPPGVEIRKQV
jgi:glycosyltransferase involved in cell wall biosynthesis